MEALFVWRAFFLSIITEHTDIWTHDKYSGDTKEIDLATIKKSIEMKPDIARIYPALVIKDTPMEIMYNRGEYKPYSLEMAVKVSREMLKLYNEAKVKVIRIGLQPTDTIAEGKDVVAGPFHPAFRELVEGSLICENIKKKINEKSDIIIEINSKDISKLYANKKYYFNKFLSNRSGKTYVHINKKVKRGKLKLTIIEKRDEFKI